MTTRVKVVGAMSYLWVLILVPLLRRNEDPFIKYHLKQGVILLLLWVLIPYVLLIPLLGWILGAVLFAATLILWIIGMTTVLKGVERPLPVIGKTIEKILF